MTALPAPSTAGIAYLIDLSGWARSIFAVTPPAASAEGEPVAVTRAVVAKLTRLIHERGPAFLGVCGDFPGPVWQHELWPGYKASRTPPGPEYETQVDRLVEILAAYRIPLFRAPGWQADDFFGTLVPLLRGLGLRVVIVSRDQDLWQLVDEAGDVVTWDGDKGPAIGAAEVRADYEGIGPELLGDLLALTGDSDEAPGIKGIGLKTAAELLLKRGSLTEVLRKWDWETGARRTRLRDGADAARMSRQLVALRDDAPAVLDLAELAVGWDAEDAVKIRDLGIELGIPRMTTVGALPKFAVDAGLLARARAGAANQ